MTAKFKLVPVEPTKEMLDAAYSAPLPLLYLDSLIAHYNLKNKTSYEAMVAAAPSPPQPIYDEEKERQLFERFQIDEGGNIDFHDGYYENVFVQSCWDGWKQCAQSRAKSVEVGHE